MSTVKFPNFAFKNSMQSLCVYHNTSQSYAVQTRHSAETDCATIINNITTLPHEIITCKININKTSFHSTFENKLSPWNNNYAPSMSDIIFPQSFNNRYVR